MKLLAAIAGSMSALSPAVAWAWESCPSARSACGACGAHGTASALAAFSSPHAYASALGVGLVVGVGSVAAERVVRAFRGRR